jgi:hypothetical protein
MMIKVGVQQQKYKHMKLNILKLLSMAALVCGCSYDFPEADSSTLPTAGEADFAKYISIGNSLTAGYMDGALYARGQSNSFPSILAKQFALVGGGEFNQPTVNSETGCYDITGGCSKGRLYFAYDSDGDATIVNKTGDGGASLAPYSGSKTALNNFGVPGLTIQAALAPQTGDNTSQFFNPYYARFASNPGTSTPIGDASAALANGGTFFSFWLGNNDAILYAINGGDPAKATLTSVVNFQAAFNAGLTTVLDASATAKGIVGNIPDVTSIAYFHTVGWNVVEFEAGDPVAEGTIQLLNSNFAGFNAALDATVAYLGHNAADAARRKVSYSTGANPILIADESLTDLSAEFDMLRAANAINDQQRAALTPYVQARPATADDLITLSASSVIGTGVGGSSTIIYGVSYPLPDMYVLVPSEIEEIKERVDTFNDIIEAGVAAHSDRLALVDAYSIFKDLKTNGASINGIGLNATLQPPYAFFSADGIHPNGRGAAYMANKMITIINTKFNARVPLTNPNDYPGNDLPATN